MVRQYAGYCGVAVVVSSGCLCLLSHSVWLLALWAVALLTAAVVAAYCSALIITAIMNEDFSCLAPKSLQCCSSSLSKKLINSVTKFIDAHMGAESRGRTMMPLCSAVLDTSLKTSKAPSLQVTSEEQPPPSDDSLIRSQLIDLSQRLHDQFVLPWYLCLSPDGLSHHQLCGVLEDVLLSCWQQLRVAGGLRSLLLDCCDLFSVLALAHSPLGHPSKRQRAAAGELGPQEYDQLSTLSQLVVLRHLPPLLLRCRGLVLLLRDLLTCNFVVPLFLKLCQPCLILQQWAAISAFSDGRVRDPSQTCDSRELQTSLLSDSRLSDQKARCAESRPGVGEELDVKNTVRDQSSAVALLQKKTSVTGRTTASLASSISQRKMLRRLLKHPNPIKIKTIFTKGVVDGMTEEDYKTSYFFNDLPRFIAPLNFHRGTYSWTHSCHKSEPSTPVHGTKAKLLVSRSESCSPVHFISRSTIQFAPGRRVSWSDPTLQLEQNSCLPKEEFTASLSKLNISGMRVLNETLTSVQDESFRQKSRDFSDVKSAYDGDKYQEIQTTTPTAGDQLYQAARSRCDTISKLNEKDLPTETKLNFNLCEKSPDFNVIESERILRPPYDESCYIRHVTKEHTGNGSLKTKASRVLSPSASNQQYLRVSVTGSSKSKNKITMSTCEERYDRETSLAPFSAPHSQLLLKKKKLVKMHSFDHFDGNIDPSLSPNVCTSCQVQCSHCIHGPGTPCVSHRVPCCLRTYRYRSGSCDEVSRRCDNYGCELLISNDNFSDDKLVVSSARDFILAPPLNEPPAQILASSVSSSNEHPSRVSLLTHPQDENTTLPPSFSESLSAQPPSHIDSGAPANYGSQTCLPSDQTSHSCLEFDSASRNLSESSKFKTRITNVNIKENLILKSDPTRRSEVVHFTGSEKNLHESSNSMNEQNGPTSNGGGISESDRELSRVTTMKQEMKSPNYETSADKLLSGLEHLSDSVFELDSDAIEASVAFSKSGEVDNSSKIAGPVDVAVKVAVPQGEMDQLDAGEGLVKGAASVEVSATSAQASDDAEELSPVYEEANNLESSIAKLRSLLSERHPHQSGGSGSSVGSSDSDLPLDPLTEVFPSRCAAYLEFQAKYFC
ncbi:Phox-associated domain [Trinorchestia longiramus]|nr:Phox-associated domain [Trinorchestia longiramus]